MSGPEFEIERKVCQRAEAKGFYVRKCSWPGRRGAPDRVFAHRLRGTVFIEFKSPGETADPHQDREHQKMRAAGIEVHVCDDADDALRILGLYP